MDGLISPRIWVLVRVGKYVGRKVSQFESEWVSV